MNAETAICNLLYRYAELMDAGDLAGAAGLFAKARITLAAGTTVEGAAPMLALWQDKVRIYPCGTPRTKHVITNPIIEVDEVAQSATCRSYYTVLQATPELPLQVVAAGRYHDRFVLEAGEWRFAERDYSLLDLVGDVSAHLLR